MVQTSPRPFFTEIRFRIQTYDIDFAGIVSNQVYIRWLEDLRLQMLQDYWPLEEQLAGGFVPVLLTTQVTYRKALRLFEPCLGRMWLPELGRVRWTLEAEFLGPEDKVAATAIQTCAFVSADGFRPLPLPAPLRERYARELQGHL